MKICVTGANGFVGTRLCKVLAHSGHQVVEVVRRKPGPDQISVGDMNAQPDWDAALAGCDAVIHLASRVHVMNETAADPEEAFRRTNVDATVHLARAAARLGVRRFIYLSSIKACGESTPGGRAMQESDVAMPEDSYGRSKLEAEHALQKIALERCMEWVVIRPPLVYGPGVKANFASLMRVVAKGWPLPLASVRNRRSLVALDNLVDFVITCVEHPKAANQIFLVSDGEDLSTPDLIRGLARAQGVAPRLFWFPVPLLRALAAMAGKRMAAERLCGNLQVDISKARSLLQWVPPIAVEEGLRRATGDTSGL